MFEQLLFDMEAELVNHAQFINQEGEEDAVSLCYKCTRQTCEVMQRMGKDLQTLSSEQLRSFEQLKNRVLVYLLYYDWRIQYFSDPQASLRWQMHELFPSADYNDWIKASIEAKKMVMLHLSKR
jgi:hypothetical protein